MLSMLPLAIVASFAMQADQAGLARGAWVGTSLMEARKGHTATLLADGRVLLVGGGSCDGRDVGKTADLFAATSMTLQRIAALRFPRREHSTTVLKNGRIVVAGGVTRPNDPVGATGTVETIFVSRSNSPWGMWQRGPDLNQPRRSQAAVPLPDGRVLVLGGFDETGTALSSTETWDGVGPRWTDGPPLNVAKGTVRAHILKDGRVVVIGTGGETEIWVPTSKRWRTLKSAAFAPRAGFPPSMLSVPLADGSIVAIG